jgi:uncharacterized protein
MPAQNGTVSNAYGVDWSAEPDMASLKRAHALMSADRSQAVRELEELADRGSSMAMCYLGGMYVRENNPFRDDKKAKYWYRRASDLGSPYAQWVLGDLCFRRREFGEARQALERGVSNGSMHANYYLGLLYMYGFGVQKDQKLANGLFREAVAAGHIRSKLAISKQYIRGYFGILGVATGVKLYLEAAIAAFKVISKDPDSPFIKH